MRNLVCQFVLLAVFLFSSYAIGQQFTEESAARFPNPGLSEYTNQLTIGDIDLDGDLDLILANGGNYSSIGPALPQRIYVNDGFGFFSDESTQRLNFSGWARGAEMGDIDDDGDLDLIFVQDFNMLPRLFENDGQGFFSDVTALSLPNITLSSTRAQFGDLDNDGDLDLYLNSGTTDRFTCGQNRVYLNDGSGIFADETAALHPLVNICNPMDVIFGDVDGDLDLDVRTGSTGTNNSRLLRNNGSGLLAFVDGVPSDSTCYSYDFGDIDGDGDLDMIGVNAGAGSTELLLENDGTGVYSNVSSQISPNPNLDDNDSKFFDYDDDGDLDLIIARLGSGGERIYNNDGNGNFTQVSDVIPIISDSSLDVMVADLTGNGKLDIVTAQGESGSYINRIYINAGPVDTHPPRIISTEEFGMDVSPAEPHVIRAAILDDMSSDRNFFDKGVFLTFSVNGGAAQQVSMKYSGGQIYRAEIPAQPAGSVVQYFVTALDFANNLGMGPTSTLEVEGALSPNDYHLIRGFLIHGTLQDLFDSDDQYLVASAGITLNDSEPPVWIEVVGTSALQSPSVLRFSIESKANTVNIRQTIELFNYVAGNYEEVDSRLAAVVDAFAYIEITKSGSDYVQPGTRQVKARIGWKRDGIILLFPWTISMDRTAWVIVK